MRFANEKETKKFNELLTKNDNNGSIFQSYDYLQMKKDSNWQIKHLISDNDIYFTVLERYIFGLGNLWYALKGPGTANPSKLNNLLDELKDFAKKQHVFLFKCDPEIPLKEKAKLSKELIKTTDIQTNIHTVLVDLNKSESTILKDLPQKGRYAINRAKKDGVKVVAVDANTKNCEIMFNLLNETANGAGFSLKPKSYYFSYWKRLSHLKMGQLFFAKFENKVVASAFVMILGKKATYKDGASNRKKETYGASYLLQWEAMLWAKEKGALSYDLCGSPASWEIKNQEHPYYRIGKFKTQFNKEVTDYVGTYDFSINKVKYIIWSRFFEKLVKRLYFMIKHMSFY